MRKKREIQSSINTVGKVIPRTVYSDPKDATPANRPAGLLKEIVFYSGKWYGCTDAATPTWEEFTSA